MTAPDRRFAIPRRLAWIPFCLLAVAGTAPARAQDAFADAVTSLAIGTNGGFGSASLPAVVLGPPRGAGLLQGSFDVVSLGSGGSITLRFDLPVICDGPGADFTVFENAFHSGSPSGPLFAEYAYVAVSQDGVQFIEFPYDATTHAGLAGQTPVLSHPDNGIDPLDPAVSGGDQFDLAAVGLAWASYVRITDVAGAIPDLGDLPQFSVAPSAGFDLDAVAALHACDPGATPDASPTPTAAPPTATPTPTSSAAASLTATPTATATAAATHDVAVSGRRPLRLRIRPGQATVTKRLRVKVRNADTAGTAALRLSAAGCEAVVGIDVDLDPRLPGAQDTILLPAGRTRAARLTVTVAAAHVATPDRVTWASCPLTVSVAPLPDGAVDPVPENNAAVVELRVLDRNDF